ncbi:JmjC domain-containing histone demethylation protein 1, partial [Tulasnella sp. 403]
MDATDSKALGSSDPVAGPSASLDTSTNTRTNSEDTLTASPTTRTAPGNNLSTGQEVKPVSSGTASTSTTEEKMYEKCPACAMEEKPGPPKRKKKESWVLCESCPTWYHWDCVGKGEDLSLVDKWYCSNCLRDHPELAITFRLPTRKSSRKRTQSNYMALVEGSSADPNKWMKIIQNKPIAPDRFRRMKGADVNLQWLLEDDNAMREPIVIEEPHGLGMRMPGWTSDAGPSDKSIDFDVDDVTKIVGGETPVEVIDVASQSNSPGWTLGRWAEYYSTPEAERDKIRNVISLEVSGTPLADQISPPKLVKDIDWFLQYWPPTKRGKGQYPKVQLYCLMSVAKCWTDMHIDFAGSSVFYHVLRGAKVFYFIRPSKANLSAYEK